MAETLALFTQRRRIIAAVALCQFSTVVCSNKTKQLRYEDAPVCNSHRKPALRSLKMHGGTSVCFVLFSMCFPGVLVLTKTCTG